MKPLRRIGAFVLSVALLFPTPLTAQPMGPPPALMPPPSAYQPLPRFDLMLVHATILDGAGTRIDDGDILIRDGRVAAIGKGLSRPEGVAVVDVGGRWITPGIIDIHTHYGTYLLPQGADQNDVNDVTELSDPIAADTWIEHAVRPGDPTFSRALAGGVTTLQILPGSSTLIGGRSVIVKPIPAITLDQMRFPDARQGVKMACGSNPASSFGGRGRAPNSRQGEISMLRTAFLDAQRYEDEWGKFRAMREDGHDRDRKRGRGGPPGGHGRGPTRDLKKDTLAAVLRGDLPVHLHCYRADDIVNWVNTLEEFGVHIAAVHHATEAYKIAPFLAKHGVCAAVWSDWWGFKREAEDGIPENAAFVDAAGGCAIMHSDIPVLGSLLNIEAAKAAAAGRQAGLRITSEQAIRWITSNPAKAIGLDDRVGTLAVGKNADLVIWSGDPFSIYSKADRVFIDGAVAYDRMDPARRPVSDFELGRPQRSSDQ
jgi:imidazolonepropionase-like amidohydrolase